MTKNNQYNLELLIDYYQDLISINSKFSDFDSKDENNRYKHLVDQLTAIRQVIIDKNMSNINSLYMPISELFINAAHFGILEEIVEFYKRNTNVNYDTVEAEQYLNSHIVKSAPADFTNVQQVTNYIGQYFDKLNTQLTYISKQLGTLVYDDLKEAIARCNSDISATMATNYEQMKSDIKRYDLLLIEHISKTSTYLTEAIEKEHARFIQRIASDSNAIIAGVSETITGEIAIQIDLIKDSMKKLEDKSFKWFCGAFIGSIFALFACSILSSTWAANKALGDAKVVKVIAVHNTNNQTTSQKVKHP